VGTSAAFGNRTNCPQFGQRYSLKPRCRNGVRHFGQGSDFDDTYAANSSWERRSERLEGAASPTAAPGDGTCAAGFGPSGLAVRGEARRPHWGQTARLAEPVGINGTWQDGQRVLNPEPVRTGGGARGVLGAARIEGAAAGGGASGAEAGGDAVAQRTTRRPGS